MNGPAYTYKVRHISENDGGYAMVERYVTATSIADLMVFLDKLGVHHSAVMLIEREPVRYPA